MASTYTTSLQIQKIGTGEQSGVWGASTNTNWDLIEQAVAGVQTITMSNADYTLTVLNGVSDEARNAVLVVGGTNSAIRKIVAPLVAKSYTVSNSTSGGFAITIGGASGSVATIPNGVTTSVYCDGTNFYSGNSGVGGNFTVAGNNTVSGNTSIGGTLGVTGNTTLGGTLAVTGTGAFTGAVSGPTASFGTNTTQLATTAFVQSALQAVYPIGAIYMGTVSTNPGTLFGFGTWSQLAPGQMLMGAGGAYGAGTTGGSADAIVVSHSHTASSSSSVTDPGHTHTLGRSNGSNDASGVGPSPQPGSDYSTNSSSTGITVGTTTTINATGSSGTNANLPPYLVVYMWQRTS